MPSPESPAKRMVIESSSLTFMFLEDYIIFGTSLGIILGVLVKFKPPILKLLDLLLQIILQNILEDAKGGRLGG